MRGRAFRPARLAIAMLAVAAIGLGTSDLIAGIGDAQAHSGQLSPKDGCHRHKAAGERHWHQDGTATRGGACIKQDGTTYRVLEVEVEIEAPAPAVAAPWDVCATEWNALEYRLGAWTGVSERAADLLGCLRGAYPRRE